MAHRFPVVVTQQRPTKRRTTVNQARKAEGLPTRRKPKPVALVDPRRGAFTPSWMEDGQPALPDFNPGWGK